MLGRSRWGEGFSRGFLTVLRAWRLAGTGPCTSKKSSGPAAASADIAGCSCRGPEQHSYSTPYYSRYSRAKGHSPAGSRTFRACGGRTRAQPHGRRRYPGFLGGLPAGFSSPICHSLESPPSPARRSSRVRWHGTSFRGPATNKTRPPPGRITWAGITGSGASAGSGPRRRRPVRVRGDLNSRFRECTDGQTTASDLTIDLPHRPAGRARTPVRVHPGFP